MSNVDLPSESAAPEGARPDPVPVDAVPVRPSRPVAPARTVPGPRRGGSVALALLLAAVAVAGCGYIGWRQWQQESAAQAAAVDAAAVRAQVDALATTVSGVSGERKSLGQRLDDAAAVNRSLREELLGQSQRTRNLEDAVARLAEKSLSGHDAMLLDETESLLRMAGERYTLFHDAQGAAAAYALADQTLAGVNDGAFSGLRQSIGAERDALARSQPASASEALQQLETLRGALADLPLKPLDTPQDGHPADAWSRIGRALAGVISVQRDNGAPLAVADGRFARELAALDLAQAQAALLAHDGKSYAAALQRVDAALVQQFDATAPDVRKTRASIGQLAQALPATAPVQTGAALNELRNLRAVHALAPAAAPAPAGSAGAPGGATP